MYKKLSYDYYDTCYFLIKFRNILVKLPIVKFHYPQPFVNVYANKIVKYTKNIFILKGFWDKQIFSVFIILLNVNICSLLNCEYFYQFCKLLFFSAAFAIFVNSILLQHI